MTQHLHLLLIDPQHDFCDVPGAALPVPGADADLRRVAQLIRAGNARIDAITVTLDAHHRLDIAHPGFWQQADGSAVAPFTAITAAALRAGAYRPRLAAHAARALAYVQALEAGGRYTLMVWPVHCEIGSWGQTVHEAVRAAYNHWEETRQRSVAKVLKGANPWTEHYSAIAAEVPDPDDAATQTNQPLLARLGAAEQILVAGEASSHCVKASVAHLVEQIDPARLILLSDCMSPVTGFAAEADAFLQDMAARGARVCTSSALLAEWGA
ncbi:isochorismatase family protein [Massilia sp. TS11]|uniref:isochorismatase family protein n=1 Tax=Massilia sp. TS11 TaxID=2908003 RepID=UPI001EDC28BB|nr:isochorismatase family protein [Massilia sp. TS11]MCG2586398.1 isochorismatase family protein [Massilia sp. TS11]